MTKQIMKNKIETKKLKKVNKLPEKEIDNTDEFDEKFIIDARQICLSPNECFQKMSKTIDFLIKGTGVTACLIGLMYITNGWNKGYNERELLDNPALYVLAGIGLAAAAYSKRRRG